MHSIVLGERFCLKTIEVSQDFKTKKISLSKGSLFGKRESFVDGTGFEPAASTMPTWALGSKSS